MAEPFAATMRLGCDLSGAVVSTEGQAACLDSREGWRQVVGTCFDRLRDRHAQFSVAIENCLGAHDGQTDNVLSAGREAEDMSLWRLLALGLLRLADMQIEHVVLGVVVGVVEGDRADSNVYSLHDRGSFRLPNAEIT